MWNKRTQQFHMKEALWKNHQTGKQPFELRNKKLLGAKDIATRSKDATFGAPGLTTRSKDATSNKKKLGVGTSVCQGC